ncbi:protein of unknown function [Burkholderia multivorans]
MFNGVNNVFFVMVYHYWRRAWKV